MYKAKEDTLLKSNSICTVQAAGATVRLLIVDILNPSQ